MVRAGGYGVAAAYSSSLEKQKDDDGSSSSSISISISISSKSRNGSSSSNISPCALTTTMSSSSHVGAMRNTNINTRNVLSQQDAGSYRCDEEDCIYLCSSICSEDHHRPTNRTFHALVQLVVLIHSKAKMKKSIFRSYLIRKSLLEVLCTCPSSISTSDTSERQQQQQEVTMTLATLFYILSDLCDTNGTSTFQDKNIVSFLDSPNINHNNYYGSNKNHAQRQLRQKDLYLLQHTYSSISRISCILLLNYHQSDDTNIDEDECGSTQYCTVNSTNNTTTTTSVTSSPVDPTRAGRARRGKKRRLEITINNSNSKENENTLENLKQQLLRDTMHKEEIYKPSKKYNLVKLAKMTTHAKNNAKRDVSSSCCRDTGKDQQQRSFALRRRKPIINDDDDDDDELMFNSKIDTATKSNTDGLFYQKIVPIMLQLWNKQKPEDVDNSTSISIMPTSTDLSSATTYPCCTIPPISNYDDCKGKGKETQQDQHQVSLEIISAHLTIKGMGKMLLTDNMGEDDDGSGTDDVIERKTNNGDCAENTCDILLRQSGCLTNLLMLAIDSCLDMTHAINNISSSQQQYKSCYNCVGFSSSKSLICFSCLSLLQKRFESLLSLLDYAVLTPENKHFLATTMSMNPNIVHSLLGLLKVCHLFLLDNDNSISSIANGNDDNDYSSYAINKLWVQDVTRSCLSVLTSLGHESSEAGQEILGRTIATKVAVSTTSSTISTTHDNTSSTGLYLILDVLCYNASLLDITCAHMSLDDDYDVARKAEKLPYDVCIFCLNVLTNTVETVGELAKSVIWKKMIKFSAGKAHSHHHGILAAIRKAQQHQHLFSPFQKAVQEETVVVKTSFLRWLTSWVSKLITGAFRSSPLHRVTNHTGDSVGTNTDDNNKNEEDVLSRQEEECLVMAGNGCILLAWLMKNCEKDFSSELRESQEENSSVSNTTNHSSTESRRVSNTTNQLSTEIRRVVIQELTPGFSIPSRSQGNSISDGGNNEHACIDVLVRTLKAFLNYYLYSVGKLSIVVVSPIVKLLSDLEEMKGEFAASSIH